MKMELSEQQLQCKQDAASFTNQYIVPYAGLHDREERLHPEVIDSLKSSGYLGSMIPREYGGMGLDPISVGVLNEEIGRGCSSVRSLLTVHGMVAIAIQKFGSEDMRSYWLPRLASGEVIGAFGLSEPGVGSDAKSIETNAELDGEGYQLNGKKKWITMGQLADLFLIFAQVNDKPTAFLVERNNPGLKTQPINGMLGVKGSMLAELHLEHCYVGPDRMVGSPGIGVSMVALHCLDYGRYTVAWGCIGLGQACLDASLSYAGSRRQFGTLLQENQLIQKMLTEIIVDVRAARLLCYQSGYLKEVMDPDSIMETWTAKYYAADMVNKVAHRAVQIHGAKGCSAEYPVERFYRDARVNEIIEGTTQMHEMVIASYAASTHESVQEEAVLS
ncbi:acyl-CoA dehydrogenase [Paenibacillus amylolyticus]|nr:acyl-CoA dehydrogenase [Paenibacillus amylolyticus]